MSRLFSQWNLEIPFFEKFAYSPLFGKWINWDWDHRPKEIPCLSEVLSVKRNLKTQNFHSFQPHWWWNWLWSESVKSAKLAKKIHDWDSGSTATLGMVKLTWIPDCFLTWSSRGPSHKFLVDWTSVSYIALYFTPIAFSNRIPWSPFSLQINFWWSRHMFDLHCHEYSCYEYPGHSAKRSRLGMQNLVWPHIHCRKSSPNCIVLLDIPAEARVYPSEFRPSESSSMMCLYLYCILSWEWEQKETPLSYWHLVSYSRSNL